MSRMLLGAVVLCAALGLRAAERPYDLYLLVGQSNMSGRGHLTAENRISDSRVFSFGRDEKFVPAVEPLHWEKKTCGAGLGMTFAIDMAGDDPAARIGLIPCAFGGSPVSSWQPGARHYTNAVHRAKLAMREGKLRGILWHQGCADSKSRKTVDVYEQQLVRALRSLRHELGADDVPIVLGELGEYLAKNMEKARVDKPEAEKLPRFRYWKEINALTSSAAKELGNATVVSAKGLTPNRDILHFDTASLREFGHRYAKAMKELQNQGAK